MYYVVVPQTTGELLLETAEGPVTSQLTTGVSYARPVGIEHNVINPSSAEFVFIEIELKSPRDAVAELVNAGNHPATPRPVR